MSEKISIYIPAYNAENTIEQTIDSILQQTINVDEIIVVNDNSTDRTEEIIKKFSKIKILNNKKNMGLGFNRNLAIKECKNKIVGGIDADVVLDKFWLEKLLKYLNHNHIFMCGGNMIEKLTQNKYNSWRAKYYSQNWGNKDLNNPPFLYGCNTLQFKNIWEKVGGYDETLITNGEDIDYTKKVKSFENHNLFYSSEALCYHLQNDDMKSLSRRIWRYHSYGYKIKKPTFYRFLKLCIKQLNFFLSRLLENLIKLNFFFIYISFNVLIDFIKLEFNNCLKK